MSMDSVSDTLLKGSNQPTHNNQPYLVLLATIIYRRGEARCEPLEAGISSFLMQDGIYRFTWVISRGTMF